MATKETRHTEIGNIPELLRLAEEVQTTKQPRVLTHDGKELVEVRPVMPVARGSLKSSKTQADLEAFRSAAGGWKGLVDPEALKEHIKTTRSSDRPPVTL